MKKKITLKLEEETIIAAKREAKRRGITLSQMFEKVMGSGGSGKIETESQRAVKWFLSRLQEVESSPEFDTGTP